MLQRKDLPTTKNTAETIVQEEKRELKSHDLVYQFPCIYGQRKTARTKPRNAGGQGNRIENKMVVRCEFGSRECFRRCRAAGCFADKGGLLRLGWT